jgi:hypothetical protein
MTGFRSMLCGLVVALVVAGCSGDTTMNDTGSLSLNLELADGSVIDRVDWTITGGDMAPMSGSIDTSAPGSTASVEVFGLPPGDDYTIALEVETDDGTTCKGSADFSVEVGQVTDVMVMLRCKRAGQLGGVRVNGDFNFCAELTKVVVSPLQTSVGNVISLVAEAEDTEGDLIAYAWSSNRGSIADASAPSTTYTCTAAGNDQITITVADDGGAYCMNSWTVAITCVDGDGGAGGDAGGTGGTGGTGGALDPCEEVTCPDLGECMTSVCNPATGQCEASNVADGMPCDTVGECMAGECVEVPPVNPPPQTSTWNLFCLTSLSEDPLELEINVHVDPDAPFSSGNSSPVDIGADITLSERVIVGLLESDVLTGTTATLDSGFVTASIVNATTPQIPETERRNLAGGTPQTVDLTDDPDGNAIPGPLVIDTVFIVTPVTPTNAASTVSFGLADWELSLTLPTLFGPLTLIFPEPDCTIGEPVSYDVD